ncbi:MAG TPA: DUF2959 family protein [Planctomycetota bacterium]|nr:DUF2959 family protein [Planctomycetota bacterium]
MAPRVRISSVVPFAALAASVVLASCASDEPGTRSGKMLTDLQTIRAEIVDGQRRVDGAIASLDALNSTTSANYQVPAAAADLRKNITSVDSAATSIRTRYDDMKARQLEYQAKWKEERSLFADASLQKSSEARAAKVQSYFDDISKQAKEAKDAYDPFIRSLRELDTYLANDPSAGAVSSAQSTVKNAKKAGEKLKDELDGLVKQIDKTTTDLGSGGAGRP